ncbi:MAG: N-acetylmuramoyl-L-alanine amidase [Firmicutes bacterium]|nr:N-acetylmuramoyl-L-alanine amidase [Bacillota bacterium]
MGKKKAGHQRKIRRLGVFVLILIITVGLGPGKAWLLERSWMVTGTVGTDVIVIDAGHGGFDGGAVSKDGTSEKDINLAIALRLAERLEGAGWQVVMTRTDDSALDEGDEERKRIRTRKTEDLRKRKEIINETKPVMAVSIHLNSFQEDPSVRGAQTFYPARAEQEQVAAESRRLAEAIQKELVQGLDDGTKREALAKKDVLLLKDPKVPTVLVECGFLSNPDDAEKLKTESYQGKLSEFIYNGIQEYSGKNQVENLFVLDSCSP